jgi:hypothetical protein
VDDRHTQLIKAAQARTIIISLVNETIEPVTMQQIYDSGKDRFDAIPYTIDQITYQLSQLAKNEMITKTKEGHSQMFFRNNKAFASLVNKPIAKEPKSILGTAPNKEIELVLNGTVIVFGVNPVTGRTRIIIDT